MNLTFADSIVSDCGLATVLEHDALAALMALPDGCVDAVVTDPPYAIRAPKRPVDLAGPAVGVRTAEHRVAEWQAYAEADMLGQQSTNWHEKATHSRGYADNDPLHFQRWCELWLTECLRVLKPGGHLIAFGGTRTWHRLATAAENVGFEIRDSLAWMYATGFPKSLNVGAAVERHLDHAPGPRPSDSPSDWHGWGTTLKPAFEPILFARAPLDGTVAANVLASGTGAINIDGTRLADDRWPTNVFLDEHQAQVLDTSQAAGARPAEATRPSRFFWHAKPNPQERGRVTVNGVKHPTVKPVALMRELVRLVTPPGGTVLDPFAGSGTTVEASLREGMRCVAFERDPAYIRLVEARVDYVRRGASAPPTSTAPIPGEAQDVLF